MSIQPTKLINNYWNKWNKYNLLSRHSIKISVYVIVLRLTENLISIRNFMLNENQYFFVIIIGIIISRQRMSSNFQNVSGKIKTIRTAYHKIMSLDYSGGVNDP